MTVTGTASPVRTSLPVRRMGFSFNKAPKYWWDGQPFMTQFMNNLSSLFPYDEKFFVDSVYAVHDRLEDLQLKKDVSAFISQEAIHSKEHATYNEYAEEHGVDLECLELRIKALLESISKIATKEHRLAITCVLEHFTTIMATRLLKHEDLTVQMQSPKMYKLQMWHAIKEDERKSIAYDMYQRVYGSYFTWVLAMMPTALMFFDVIGWFQLNLLRKDDQLFNWRSWKHGLGTLFGLREGFFARLLLPYLDYYRLGFHPSDHDTTKLEKYWKDKLALTD